MEWIPNFLAASMFLKLSSIKRDSPALRLNLLNVSSYISGKGFLAFPLQRQEYFRAIVEN